MPGLFPLGAGADLSTSSPPEKSEFSLPSARSEILLMQTLKKQLQQVKKTGWSLFLSNSLDFLKIFLCFLFASAVYGADGGRREGVE